MICNFQVSSETFISSQIVSESISFLFKLKLGWLGFFSCFYMSTCLLQTQFIWRKLCRRTESSASITLKLYWSPSFSSFGGRSCYCLPKAPLLFRDSLHWQGIFHFLLSYQQGRLVVLYKCYVSTPLTCLPFIARLFLPILTGKTVQDCGVPRSYDVQYFSLVLHYFCKFWDYFLHKQQQAA